MVDIAPFRALRSTAGKKFADISAFICPPYDVISPHQRTEIEGKFPKNVVKLELPNGINAEKYAHAANILNEWKAEGFLQEDRTPAFYLLETTFRIKDAFAPSKRLKRYGVMAGLKIETPGKGAVHPHEKTLPKAKEERLNLITALKTDVSPIFGLFFDKKKEWRRWVAKVIREKPLVKGGESKELSHRMWKIDSPVLQKEIRRLLKKNDLYIADGHHRYEVSWAYKEARLQENPSADLDSAWHRVMTYICPMEEPGLLMLPTHRMIKSSHTISEWREHLESLFQIRPVKNMDALIKELKKPKERAIGWVYAGGLALMKLKSNISLERCLAGRPKALQELDVVLLHDVALGEALTPSFLQEKEIVFVRDLEGMQALAEKDPSWVGFVLSSPGVESLARVAGANEVMPPKTTYFYPKVPTGFTLMGLEQKIK